MMMQRQEARMNEVQPSVDIGNCHVVIFFCDSVQFNFPRREAQSKHTQGQSIWGLLRFQENNWTLTVIAMLRL